MPSAVSKRRSSTANYMEASAGRPPGGLTPLALPADGSNAPSGGGGGASPSPHSPSKGTTSLQTTTSSSNLADPGGNPEDMTPEQIEEMIRRLMLAKQVAMVRRGGGLEGDGGRTLSVPGM